MNILSTGFECVFENGFAFPLGDKTNDFYIVFSEMPFSANIGGKNFVCPGGTATVSAVNVPLSFASDGEFFVCDWILCDLSGETEFMETVGLVTGYPSLCSDTKMIQSLFRNIFSSYYSLSADRTKKLEMMMRMLLSEMSCGNLRSQSTQQSSEPHYSALVSLREKIYRTPQLKWNVDMMASEVSMSRSYFQHIYTETFGVSCMSDVISGKIEKAKEILSETDCTVSQVASMCGYDNEEHFMRQFKRIVGMTPTNYRHIR